MKIDEYRRSDGMALAAAIAGGELSASEVAAAAEAAITADNGVINAVIGRTEVERDAALKRQPGCQGPLAGVPFLVKDIGIAMAGVPCELGSRLAAGLVAPADDALATRMKAAGLVTVGRSNTPEFGFNASTEPLHLGSTRNPWHSGYSAGGSSGGAAAAVAAGMVPVAHANDGGGSIRIPAHCCGVLGLKPSRGTISAAPTLDEAFFGLGTQLVVSRSVRDSAAMLDALAGREPGDRFAPRPASSALAALAQPLPPLHIAFWDAPLPGAPATDPDYRAALHELADQLRAAGHRVSAIAPTIAHGEAGSLFIDLASASLAHLVDALAHSLSRPIDERTLEQATLACYHHGKSLRAIDIVSALERLNSVSRRLGALFGDYDLILSPVGTSCAPRLEQLDQNRDWGSAADWGEAIFQHYPIPVIGNVSGVPGISIPLGLSPQGLPWGSHLLADMGGETLLLQLAALVEALRPWPLLPGVGAAPSVRT